jgi:hypothetical protein
MRLEHRVHTGATPGQVWAVLGDPSAWPTIELFTRGIRGRATRVLAGQRLMALVRMSVVAIPVDVLEVVPEERLVLLVHTAPGLREQLSFDLTPSLSRGCDIRVSIGLEGPFALGALAPAWLAAGLTARVLAARTQRQARLARPTAA